MSAPRHLSPSRKASGESINSDGAPVPTQEDAIRRKRVETRSDGESARHVLATHHSYEEAQRDVDYLAGAGVGVSGVAILGHDLRLVEQVIRRRGLSEAVMEGSFLGAAIGATSGFLLGLLTLVRPLVSGLVLAIAGAVAGALIGAALSALSYPLRRGGRDFSSVGRIEAARYDVVIDAGRAAETAAALRARSVAAVPHRESRSRFGAPTRTRQSLGR